jgi:chromosome segregation ATPase
MPVDVSTVVVTAALSSCVQVGIGYLFKRTFDRNEQKLMSLKSEVQTLREQRVTNIEEKAQAHDVEIQAHAEALSKLEMIAQAVVGEKIPNLEEDIAHGKASRGRMHEEIKTINSRAERHDEQLAALQAMNQRFNDAALKLERVVERVDNVSEKIASQGAQLFELAKQVSATAAEVKAAQK